MSNHLVIVCGCPRSGTSWVWGLLISNKNFKPLLIEDFPGIKSVGDVRKMKLENGFRTTETTVFFSNLTDVQIKHDISKKIKDEPEVFFVEKTPPNLLKLDRIIKLFPEAKIIHIIRDPRAVANSMLRTEFATGFKFARSLGKAINLYRDFYTAGKRYENYENLIRVGYEDLQKNPELVYSRMLEFIGSPALSKKEIKKIFSQNKNKVQSIQPGLFRKGKIDSYKKELTKDEIKKIEEKLKDVMIDYGYKI